MQQPDKKGYVYILVNPTFSGYVKVGRTTREPEARARELSSTSGVPAPFAVAWDAFVTDCAHVERIIHQRLAHTRSRTDREFFVISLKEAISIISKIVEPYSCESIELVREDSLGFPLCKTQSNCKVIDKTFSEINTDFIRNVSANTADIQYRDALEQAVSQIREEYLYDERFHSVRCEAEANARKLLSANIGNMTPATIRSFLDFMNTENINGKTDFTRFGRHFTNIIASQICSCPTHFNEYIGALWNADVSNIYVNFAKFIKNNPIKGAGTILPTFVLYLRIPSDFAIYTKNLVDNLAKALSSDIITRKKLCDSYSYYNHIVNECLVNPFGFKSHEVDFVLSKLPRYMALN